MIAEGTNPSHIVNIFLPRSYLPFGSRWGWVFEGSEAGVVAKKKRFGDGGRACVFVFSPGR